VGGGRVAGCGLRLSARVLTVKSIFLLLSSVYGVMVVAACDVM
jgi:hypothetical protein